MRQIGVLKLCLQALLLQTAHLYGCLQVKQPITLTPIEQLLLEEEKALAAAHAKKDKKSAHKQKQTQAKQQSDSVRQHAALTQHQAASISRQQTEQSKQLCQGGNKQGQQPPDMPEQQQQMTALHHSSLSTQHAQQPPTSLLNLRQVCHHGSVNNSSKHAVFLEGAEQQKAVTLAMSVSNTATGEKSDHSTGSSATQVQCSEDCVFIGCAQGQSQSLGLPALTSPNEMPRSLPQTDTCANLFQQLLSCPLTQASLPSRSCVTKR